MIKFLTVLMLICFADARVDSQQRQPNLVLPKQPHQKAVPHTPPSHTTHATPQAHNACPSGCAQEVALKNQVADIKYQIKEERRKTQDVLHGRTSNPSKQPAHLTAKAGVGSCEASCHTLDFQKVIIAREKEELARVQQQHRDAIEQMKHKAQAAHQPAASQHTTTQQSPNQKIETCPRNCVEAVHALDQVYQLRQQIEQAKHVQNPNYTMRAINKTNVQSSGQHCQADCAQVKGIQRQVEKYQADLAKIQATAPQLPPRSQANHSTALVVHQGESKNFTLSHVQPPPLSTSEISAMTHPKEMCINVGRMLKLIYELEQKIHALNPRYTPHVAPVDLAKFNQDNCSAEDPEVMELRTAHGTLQSYLKNLQNASHGQSGHTITSAPKPLALPAPKQHATPSTALVPHTPVTAGTCPKNCHEAWYYLQETYKLRQEIEQAKLALNPHYTVRQINPPTMQDSGQRCHADCAQVIGIQRQVAKYTTELAQLRADHTKAGQSTALVPHTPVTAGTCPKNCHEAYYYLHEIQNVRQQIEQAKHAKDQSYQMQTIKAPTMQDSTQHCHGDCPQVLGIQRQLKKFQDELAAIHAGNALPAPQQGLKGQCKPGCDNETALRIDVQNLNKELDQLKHKADPSYRVKTYKPIPATKTGVTCPAGCGNLKQLEKRKIQLEQAIAQMRSGHAQPIITEPDDDSHALVPYTGGGTDDDYSGPTIEDVTDQPQPKVKKPGFFSRVKTKISGAASTVRNKFRRNPSSGTNNQLVPYDGNSGNLPGTTDDLDGYQPVPPRGGYNPYGTDDDLNYSQGYGYNPNTGSYDPYSQYGQGGYGYNLYGSSSTTHTESPMSPGIQGGNIMRSDDEDNAESNDKAAAAAMAVFGGLVSGLATTQQPAATAPAQPPAIAPAPAPQQPVQSQSIVPQDDGDFDALYGGSGNYAPPTGTGSSSYSGSSYGSGYGSSSSSYGSGSYSSPSSPRYGSSSYGSSGSSYGSGYNSSGSGYNSDYDY